MTQPNPQPVLLPNGAQQTAQHPAATASPPLAVVAKPRSRSTMHPGVLKLAVLCWAGLIAVFWITFQVNANAMFVVAVGT
ncbi:MAG TPA: hypothetical protein VL026_12750, partial [Rhizomicrobium sp.]|nr:hypothetical protein [Rhizomicrobium sp.]